MSRLFSALVLVFILLFAHSAFAFPEIDAASIVKKVRRSVIRVNVGVTIDQPVAFQAGEGGGSGVVFQIDYDKGVAYAITNHHVSGDSVVQSVRFWDGAEYKAEMIARTPGIDVALLKISGVPDERNLPMERRSITASPLGDSDKVQIGDYAVAMGSPGSYDGVGADRSDPWQGFMLQQTTTMRVVSGKQTDPLEFVRDWTGWRMELGYEVMTDLPWRFMVQSAINGGNSGGPSFNSAGEVIGLNHAGWPAGQGVLRQNENYTIPINFVKNFIYQILDTGKYELPWMGIDILIPEGCDTSQKVEDFVDHYYDPEVAKVLNVRRDSPAERAGIKKGDVIVQFDGQTFPTNSDLRMHVFTLPIGKKVPVTVKRGMNKAELEVEIVPKRGYDSEFSF